MHPIQANEIKKHNYYEIPPIAKVNKKGQRQQKGTLVEIVD